MVALGALIVAASRPASWFARDYPTAAAHAVADTAGPNRAVFANGAFADWLLLKAPSLRGRVAYDARFEVLPDGRLADAAAVSIGRYDSEQILRPFDVLVLRPEEKELRANAASAPAAGARSPPARRSSSCAALPGERFAVPEREAQRIVHERHRVLGPHAVRQHERRNGPNVLFRDRHVIVEVRTRLGRRVEMHAGA